MEKIFRVMNCADNQKVNYVVFMLIVEAEYWCDGTRRLLEGGRIIITWDVFEELGKYSTFFYHPEERMKCIKFENGLRNELRKAVGILEIVDFPTLIHKCRFLEDFENNQNIKPKYFGPHTNKNKRIEGKPYNRPQWRT